MSRHGTASRETKERPTKRRAAQERHRQRQSRAPADSRLASRRRATRHAAISPRLAVWRPAPTREPQPPALRLAREVERTGAKLRRLLPTPTPRAKVNPVLQIKTSV